MNHDDIALIIDAELDNFLLNCFRKVSMVLQFTRLDATSINVLGNNLGRLPGHIVLLLELDVRVPGLSTLESVHGQCQIMFIFKKIVFAVVRDLKQVHMFLLLRM